jgi:SAM-dependent methyltransferase
MTTRRPTSSVLDVGCGTGYHALRAAGHAASLTATDVNPRALHVTRLNAALNDVAVECLEGDLFAPVAGRRFGLIVALPPFVVAPEGELAFLSTGTSDDAICRRLAREVPDHLDDGGFCQFLAQWAVPDGVPWDEHLAGWFDDRVTAWVLRSETDAPAAYAARTLDPMCTEDHEFAARLDRWVEALARRGIGAIGTGLVTLRRGGPSWRRFDDLPSGRLGTCGDDVAAMFEATDVARTASDDALLALRAEAATGAEVVQRLRFRDGALHPDAAELHRPGALAFPGTVTPTGAAVLARCDGRTPLGEVVAAVAAQHGAGVPEAAAALLPMLRSLLECGFLRPVSPASSGGPGG